MLMIVFTTATHVAGKWRKQGKEMPELKKPDCINTYY